MAVRAVPSVRPRLGMPASARRASGKRLETSMEASAVRVDLRGLLGLVRELALGLERAFDTGRKWQEDVYTFDAFASALGTILENLRPRGEAPDRCCQRARPAFPGFVD